MRCPAPLAPSKVMVATISPVAWLPTPLMLTGNVSDLVAAGWDDQLHRGVVGEEGEAHHLPLEPNRRDVSRSSRCC